MKTTLFFFILAALPLTAQTHPFSNAWSYVTYVATSDLQLSGTTVAGTGGTSTHTMNQIAVYLESPNLRTASATDYPSGTTGQATAYLSLCGGGFCEDGNFLVSSVGTSETCGTTSTTLYLDTASQAPNLPAWITWISVTANPATISRTSSNSTITGNLRKSSNCTSVGFVSNGLTLDPTTIQASPSPNSTITPSFANGNASVSWTVNTTSGHPSGGSVIATLGIESTPCTIPGGPVKSVTVTVAP